MLKVNDLSVTSLETITAFGLTSGDYLFTLDELQNATIANTQETTDVTGKGGRLLNTLKRNKAVTVSGTNGLLSGGLMEIQTGSTFNETDTEVRWTDYLTVKEESSAMKATTSYKAIGTAGAEIIGLFVKNEDGTLGAKLEQDSAAAEGKFAYDPSTKTLTFAAADVENGSEIVVFYDRKINANVLANDSDKFSGKAKLYVDAFAEDKCGNIYRVQFYIPKADFSGEFSLDFGGDQSVHAFEARGQAGACGEAAGGNLWTYTIFGVDAADAT